MEAVILVRQIIEQSDREEVLCRLIRDVVRCAGTYVSAVNELELELLCADPTGQQYRDTIENLDRNRTLAHNGLIDSINICNRYLRKLLGDAMPPGGIYPEPDHIANGNRRAIGDWAGKLSNELFCHRR